MSEATEIASMGITTMIELMQARDEIKRLKEALAKQEQGEPVAAIKTYADGIQDAIELLEDCNGNSIGWLIDRLGDYKYASTTTPQQRKPLTDEQIKRIWESLPFCNGAWETFARRIEAAHGIAPQGSDK